MRRPLRPLQLTFRAKVLLPVVTVMVVLALVPLAFVTQRMSRQFEAEAAENLLANEAVFKSHHAVREKNLVLRYRNVPNEPRFKAVVQLADPKTTEAQLRELLDELGGDAVFYANAEARLVVSVSRDPQLKTNPLAERCTGLIRQAFDGQPAGDTMSVGKRLFDVVSIPVSVGPNIIGALTIANEIGQAVAEEFTRLTRSEIILLADGHIAVSSLQRPELELELKEAMATSSEHEGTELPAKTPAAARRLTLRGEHFMYATGHLGRGRPEDRVSYILLSSYEKPLRLLQATERIFLWIQLLGILVGIAIVWWLIHRVTQPLHKLRDCAEAVGRGDFSQRVEVAARDECGALASGFNQMTTNLQASRAQLETTIEALRSTQAQLIQSEKMRAIGTLAGGIAHDFNNILGAILGYTELVLDDVPMGSRTERNLRQVLNASHRAKDLVRQILAFSRQSEPQRANVRLSAIIDETFKLLRASIPSTIQISQQINTTADHVIADPTQLHQVLMNLGTNASHAMREKGGTLSVTVDEHVAPDAGAPTGAEGPQLSPGPWLRVTVADTGHGMDQAVLERIFEPFFTTKPIGEGTGLGLSVVHGIIKNHGGEITVTSKRGEGTTFQIHLPRAEATDAAAGQSGEAVRGQHQRILVVDDEESLANMMHQRLTRLGYDVLACQDSVHALGMIQAAPQNFDLVVSDQTMPRLTGSDLAAEISRLELTVPVILCSGSPAGLPKPAEWCRNVRGCILKPVNFVDLSQTIHRVLHETKRP